MLTSLLCFALTVGSPQPADTYYSDMSPETAQHIMECVLNEEEYREYLDFNGDGKLNLADYIGVRKRYEDNCTYGNEITVDEDVIQSIYEENFNDELINWNICFINDNPCREYELSVSEITEACICYEFEECIEYVYIEINPFTECVRVTS